MNNSLFTGNLKMADLLMINGRLVYLLPSFGIELGFGEKTVEEVCAWHGISLPLFLIACNQYTYDDYAPDNTALGEVTIQEVVAYLQNSHKCFLETDMPEMVGRLLALAEHHVSPASKNMLVTFCEKYRQDVVAHVRYEEEVVFPYIRKLSAGEISDSRMIEYHNSHEGVYSALRDLRGIIMKYIPHSCSVREALPLLIDLFIFEYNLHRHTRLEDTVLIPLMEQMADEDNNGFDSKDLTERERQTLAAIARGMSNKEIAESLQISTHTVVSYRKNIIRKTGVKTAPGLTLYAFINKLVTLKDLR